MRWRSLAPHQDPQHKVKRSTRWLYNKLLEECGASVGVVQEGGTCPTIARQQLFKDRYDVERKGYTKRRRQGGKCLV
ncbi:protein of unknown function [Methanoculleus bourgensis]|uniref:Uncharacterized protein n=1 Tax=Methanoculleus bourgensis TaxID=83986 RepID=A0A0X3BMM7_9EURY|nr:protein of unknown function [Methanoculleus bourgensis]